MQYLWLGVLICAIVVEVITAGLVSVWFVPAALVAMVLALFEVPLYLQIIVFLGLSLIFIVLSRTIWKKYTSIKPLEPTNTDVLLGEVAVVTEEIDNINSLGEVKVNGQRWSARSVNGERIELGEKVKVLSIEGVKVICEKSDI